MMESVNYENGVLKIHYSKYGEEGRNYDELFNFLGDFDIITASEIGQDVIVLSGEVFLFTSMDEGILKRNSFVEIEKLCSLTEFIEKNNQDHIDFLNWYNYQPGILAKRRIRV